MTITNPYCTLAQIKARLGIGAFYAASTLGFTASTKTIADTALGLKGFASGHRITIAGSASNNGTYDVATGGVAGSLVVSQTLVNEGAGAAVTITDVTDPLDDATLGDVINGVSRLIDDYCARQFYLGSANEARYFSAADRMLCYTDDVVSITEVATDDAGDRSYSNVWAVTDWEYGPRNAAAHGKPYTWIQVTPNGANAFPNWRGGVRIKATYGWSAVPPQVQQASLIQTMRLFKRKDAPFGVMGSAEMGQLMVIPKLDPDIVTLLRGVRRLA